jgi:hypothetical protein
LPAPSLAELQASFLDAVRTGASPAPALAGVVRPPHGLGVYVDAYFWRLRGVLATDFPQLARAVGDDAFTALARGYLAAQPSRRPSVRHLGERLPAWLRRRVAAPGEAAVAAWAPELAALEWARVDVFDAPDEPPLRAADLAVVAPDDWPALALEPIAALALLAVDWPVHRLWDDPAADVAPAATCIRVWRQDHLVHHAVVDRAEHDALARLRAGAPFASACEVLPDAAEAAALLARWLEDGLLARMA